MTPVSVSGGHTAYSLAGHGPGLALLHGTVSDGRATFGRVIDRFTDIRTVITIDYGGCGDSAIPDGDLRLSVLVKQAAAAIRAVGIGPVDVLGISLGAVVAAATAASHPDLIRRVVLVAGWGTSADARHKLVFGTWAKLQALEPELGARYGISLVFSPDFLHSLDGEQLTQMIHRPAHPDTLRRIELGGRIEILDEMSKVTAPTLVVGMNRDYIVPPYQCQRLHAAIAGSCYAEVESGHVGFVENPEELVRLIRSFLSDASPASSSSQGLTI